MFFYEQLLLTSHSVRPKNLGLRAPLLFSALCSAVFHFPLTCLLFVRLSHSVTDTFYRVSSLKMMLGHTEH